MTTDNVTPIRASEDHGPPSMPVVTEPKLEHLTDSELASLERQSPGLLADIRKNEALEYGIEPANPEPNPIAYDNGIEPDAALRVAL